MSDIASSDQVSEIARSEPGIGGMPCLADYMIYQQDPANGSNAMAHLLLLSHDNAVTMEDVHIF